MVIGLDFDDILMDFHTSVHEYCNDKYKTDMSRDRATSYSLEELWNCTTEEVEKRVVDFYHSDAHTNARPVPGAPEAVRKLSQDNSLVVITSRPDSIKERTLEWLDRHYGKLFDHVYFTNLFVGSGVRKTKLQACEELGVEVFVEDFLGYANNVAESGRRVLLYDAPWNRDKGDHPNITRVYSWNHILEVLSLPNALR